MPFRVGLYGPADISNGISRMDCLHTLFKASFRNLHDFYAGLERIFHQIATTIDGNLPTGREWHRDLLQQMQTDLPDLRPPVLSNEAGQALDEFLRFRHVVRNIYAFQFDPESVERLVQLMSPAFHQAQTELLAFAEFLEQVGQDPEISVQ